MVLFNLHLGSELFGEAFPVGGCSENSCPLAQLPWEGHAQGWGKRPVPVCAGAGPTEPGTGPSVRVLEDLPHCPGSPGLAPACSVLQQAQLPGPRRDQGQAPAVLHRKGKAAHSKRSLLMPKT